jgi:hypothetical protein
MDETSTNSRECRGRLDFAVYSCLCSAWNPLSKSPPVFGDRNTSAPVIDSIGVHGCSLRRYCGKTRRPHWQCSNTPTSACSRPTYSAQAGRSGPVSKIIQATSLLSIPAFQIQTGRKRQFSRCPFGSCYDEYACAPAYSTVCNTPSISRRSATPRRRAPGAAPERSWWEWF